MLAAAAAATFCLLGLGACSTNHNGVTIPTTTLPGNGGTAGGSSSSGSGPSPTAEADAVCSEIIYIQRATGNLNLATPQPGAEAASTISSDISKLKAVIRGVTQAGQPQDGSGSVNAMVSDVKQAITQGQAATTSFSNGHLNVAGTDWNNATRLLEKARKAGAAANLKSCA